MKFCTRIINIKRGGRGGEGGGVRKCNSVGLPCQAHFSAGEGDKELSVNAEDFAFGIYCHFHRLCKTKKPAEGVHHDI